MSARRRVGLFPRELEILMALTKLKKKEKTLSRASIKGGGGQIRGRTVVQLQSGGKKRRPRILWR